MGGEPGAASIDWWGYYASAVIGFQLSPEQFWDLSLIEWWQLYSAKCGTRHEMAKRGLSPGEVARMRKELDDG